MSRRAARTLRLCAGLILLSGSVTPTQALAQDRVAPTPTLTPTPIPPPAPVPPATSRALFALIVGVNASLQADVAPLRYADDDAARYQDLFRALGARTYLLSTPDANTRRLHPQAAAESLPARHAELRQLVGVATRDIAQARSRGVPSTLYVVYAGHGDVDDRDWYLTLEDGRLTGAQLMSEVVEAANADQTHVIIDACHAYLLALPRGPGGSHRPLGGFVEREAAARAGRVGFLLSSSASGESHEWAGFEAGVFSHEVRSGLYGAADADGDGKVTYSEIGAFVARANETIKNDRFRPQVLARAPSQGDLLLDLRGRSERELRMDGPSGAAHYLLENGDGVRLLDFHGDGRSSVHLLRPPGDGALYLRRVSDGSERLVPPSEGALQMDRLPVALARSQARGAAHQAFSQIFALQFDGDAVTSWARSSADALVRLDASERTREIDARRFRLRRLGAIAALTVAASAAVGAIGFELSARGLSSGAPADESQRDAVGRNDRIAFRERVSIGLAVGSLVAGLSGAWLWPRREPERAEPGVILGLAAFGDGGDVTARWHF